MTTVARSARRANLKPVALRALATFLIIWTPFFVFSAYRGYPLPTISTIYSVAIAALLAIVLAALCGRAGKIRQAIVFTCLIALVLDIQFEWFDKLAAYAVSIALLGLFWVLREHLSIILAVTFGTLLASTAILASLEPHVEEQEVSYAAAPTGEKLDSRRIVHLILDEHAGLQGIPADLPGGETLRQDLREFFVSNGFRLFGNAISEYASSKDSISGILNFTAGQTPYDRYRGREPFVLTENAYFDAAAEDGYTIDVYQSTYLDYCSEASNLIGRCFTYWHDGTDWLAAAPLSDFEKLKFFFGMYLQLSEIAESALKFYAKLEVSQNERNAPIPRLPQWDAGPSSINAMSAFDRFIDEVSNGSGGKLYFAHLLMPHGPYAFDANCLLRSDTSTWASHRPPYRKDSTESERARSYSYYFDQLRCTMQRLQTLFDGLQESGHFDDATIVIHGDHGSRIFQTAPRAQNVGDLTSQDYLDGFSTLFAAKSPHLEAGYDAQTAPISQLLARAIGQPELVNSDRRGLFVFLEGEDDDGPRRAASWPILD